MDYRGENSLTLIRSDIYIWSNLFLKAYHSEVKVVY